MSISYKITYQTGNKRKIHTDETPQTIIVVPQGRESARKAFKRAYREQQNEVQPARITKIEEL